MDTINNLEHQAAELYKAVPHLPKQGRTWLATNMWWITLVSVILVSIGIFGIVAGTFFASAALTIYGGVAGVAIAGIAVVAALMLIAFMAVTVVLGVMAINPLKTMQRKGWTLLFIIMLVHVVEQFVAFLFNFSLFGLIWGLFFTAIGGYFLFEIRDFYGKAVLKAKLVTSPIASKSDTK